MRVVKVYAASLELRRRHCEAETAVFPGQDAWTGETLNKMSRQPAIEFRTLQIIDTDTSTTTASLALISRYQHLLVLLILLIPLSNRRQRLNRPLSALEVLHVLLPAQKSSLPLIRLPGPPPPLTAYYRPLTDSYPAPSVSRHDQQIPL